MTDHVIAIVGNPNCGKTTLFNALTGARQRVGNWPGVTVERRSGHYSHNNNAVELVDLPGTYCLDVVDNEVSIDERIARDYILSSGADLVVNIIDASNLERNLYLTTQLLDMHVPVVVVLNMMDVAADKGIIIDTDALSGQLGCPVLTVVASKSEGVKALKQQLDTFLRKGLKPGAHVSLGDAVEASLDDLAAVVAADTEQVAGLRWRTLKLLDGEGSDEQLFSEKVLAAGSHQRKRLEEQLQNDMDILIANGRYTAIAAMMAHVIRKKGETSHKLSERIDRIVLNRIMGLPVFFGVMYLMFMFSINLGSAFIDFFDGVTGTLLVDGLGHFLTDIGAPAWLVTVLANGVGGGIQTVSTFIPVIGCLFLFLSLLEDSGYMARAAFVMDRAMRFLGLPGKAFVPMIVGFGCNVPAIMATRTLENEKDRLLTISMAPFMSCGARLPVYALFAAAFFPATGQNVVFILYLVGIAAAVFTGLIVKRSLLAGESSPFVMELPNYHMPSLKQVLLRTWDRLKAFMVRAGKAIVLVVVILNTLNSIGADGSLGHENTEASMLSKIGQTITPMFAPMGMTEENWPAAVGIFTGILAKEAVVGTLDSMYQAIADAHNGGAEDGAEEFSIWAGIQAALATIPENLSGLAGSVTDPMGVDVGDLSDLEGVAEEQGVTMNTFSVMRNLFPSTAAVIAYLLFILLYTPCVAALGAVYRETTLSWTLFVAGWTFLLGYAVATLYYQLSLISVQPLVSLGWVAVIAVVMAAVFMLMKRMGGVALKAAEASTLAPSAGDCGKGCSC